VSGAAKVHFGIDHLGFTLSAMTGGLILEELNHITAFGTFHLKDRVLFPESRVLPRASHLFPP